MQSETGRASLLTALISCSTRGEECPLGPVGREAAGALDRIFHLEPSSICWFTAQGNEVRVAVFLVFPRYHLHAGFASCETEMLSSVLHSGTKGPSSSSCLFCVSLRQFGKQTPKLVFVAPAAQILSMDILTYSFPAAPQMDLNSETTEQHTYSAQQVTWQVVLNAERVSPVWLAPCNSSCILIGYRCRSRAGAVPGTGRERGSLRLHLIHPRRVGRAPH